MSSKPKRSKITETLVSSIQVGTPEASLGNSASDEYIRRRAYEIYLDRGEQSGRQLDDWLQAERELRPGAL